MSDISLSNEFRILLVKQAEKLSDEVALCLSGGIDSVALLFTLLNVGKKVTAYSFTLQDIESYDYQIAKQLAKKYDLKFTSIKLSTNIYDLKQDVLSLHDVYDCSKKTEYECVWPFIWLYPKVIEPVVVTGLGAEGHFGTTKRGAIYYKDNLDQFRKEFFSNDNVGEIIQHRQLAKKYNKELWFPFLTNEVKNLFFGKLWQEINTPHLKQTIITAFQNEFDRLPVKLKSSNLQLGSGISEFFDKLLDTDWNINNYKSVVGIFNQVNKGTYNGKRKLV